MIIVIKSKVQAVISNIVYATLREDSYIRASRGDS